MAGLRVEPSRRDVLRAASATPLLAAMACRGTGLSGEARGNVPRNLLVIVSDDQSRIDLGCYGNPACTTPHIDRLAREGVRFERAYTPVPVCQPARSSLYTGLYPQKNGAVGFGPIRPDVPTWTELLGDQCFTAAMGKRNVEPWDERFRFEFYDGVGVQAKEGVNPARYQSLFADLLEQVGERRFAAIVNLRDPHKPFHGERFVPEVDGRPARPHSPADVWVPPFLWDTSGARDELAAYYDVLRRMDDSTGRMLRVLAERGRANDTLVLFTSDNGMPFPFSKSTLYEPGINVPFVVRWPGVVEADGVSEAMVSLVDLLPTALETFGVAEPGPLDGRSLLPLLRGEIESVRERVIGVYDELLTEGGDRRPETAVSAAQETPPSRSIRDERYKYIRNFRIDIEFKNNVLANSQTWRNWTFEVDDHPGLAERMRALRFRPPEELFGLELDPWELNNLAGDARYADELDRLRGELRDWMTREEDPLIAEWAV